MSSLQDMMNILQRMIDSQQTYNMKTLSDVVVPLVKEMAKNGEQFSAHDVTVEARKSINSMSDIFNLPTTYDHQGRSVYDVKHNEVKDIVNDVFRDGDLERVFNGTYFVYSGIEKDEDEDDCVRLDTFLQPTPREIADRVVKYLKKQGCPCSMRYIMGSCFRFDYIPLKEVCEAINRDKRLKWLDNMTRAQTRWIVDLV